MLSDNPSFISPQVLDRILRALSNRETLTVVSEVFQYFRHIVFHHASPGLYEVETLHIQLTLCDPSGKKAIYSKHEQVKFLQDNAFAYLDQAWGDGNIFAQYACSPGIAVDRYREGNRFRVLISLREMRKRGESETFHIQRTILNGFTKRVEHFQAQIDHRMKRLTMEVVFPQNRLPKSLQVIEQHRGRTIALGPEARQTLADGNELYSWHTKHPRLFEAYILRWTW